MLFKDRLFSKYGDNLSFSDVKDELESVGFLLTNTSYDPNTFTPYKAILFSYYEDGQKKTTKLRGQVLVSGLDNFSKEDLYNILEQIDSLLLKDEFVKNKMKNLIILNRYEQNETKNNS